MATKILLVDDEIDAVEITKTSLESRGFEVVCAYDGLDALGKAKELKPDLILLDLFMPLVHGYEVCKRLKKDPNFRNTPIILVSGGKESPKEAKDAGAVDCVFKPVDLDELVDKIRFYTKK